MGGVPIPVEMHQSCPLCGMDRLLDRWDVNGYALARCEACSLVFVRNRVDGVYLDNVYGSTPADESNRKLYLDPSNDVSLRYAYHDLAKRIRKRMPEAEGVKRRLLDVGCSRGVFFDEFPDWETHGVEILEEDGRAAQERAGNIFIGNMSDARYPADYFDCVTLQDSLDHSHDPLGVVVKCREALKPGGLIAIKVHNISCWFAKVTGRGFYAINPPGHLFYFNLATLKLLLDRAGLEYRGHYYNTQRIRLATAFLRQARSDSSSLFAKVHRKLNGTRIGRLPIYKNLHDIITVFGVKK